MRVFCTQCQTDVPALQTACFWNAIEGDTTINDHISLYHPDEFVAVEGRDEQGRMVITPTGKKRSDYVTAEYAQGVLDTLDQMWPHRLSRWIGDLARRLKRSKSGQGGERSDS